MDPEISFGRWLRWRRRMLDVTQDVLARRVGCSVVTIRKLEADERRPSPHLATRLADVLEVAAADRPALIAFARAEAPLDTPPAGPVTWRAPSRPPSNLPTPLTRLIGRQPELAAIRNALDHGAYRLLTIIGPPGIGKTRLGVAAAAAVRDGFTDGVFLVTLASVTDPKLVVATIAQTLGLRETSGQPVDSTLQHYLRSKRLLALLDNCEHLVACAPDVASLLEACPGVRILATSRAALHIQGERLIPVPPLALPSLTALPKLGALARTPAVALFIERAQAVAPSFTLTAENAPAVAAICTRLDGLPLAIELVAARIARYSPQALLTRLDHRLALLTDGPLDLPPRQRSLRAAIGWSVALLDPATQQLFRQLGVFAGCTLAAGEAVCTRHVDGLSDSEVALAPQPIRDRMATLVENSLLQSAAGNDGELRFTMLETVREYALDQLEASDGGHEAEAIRWAHARYLLGLVEEQAFAVYGPEGAAWLARVEREHDNIRAALAWARAQGEVELGLRLAASLTAFWYTIGSITEGRGWMEGLLAQAAPAAGHEDHGAGAAGAARVSSVVRAKALAGAGYFAWVQQDSARARAAAEEALALARGQPADWAAGVALGVLGIIAWDQGDLARAKAFHEEGVQWLRAAGELDLAATFLTVVGTLALEQGDLERAQACCAESLAFARRTGAHYPEGGALACLADVARKQGDLIGAEVLGRERLLVWRRLGSPTDLVGALEGLALTVAAAGVGARAERVARLLGAVAAVRERVDAPQDPRRQTGVERAAASARAALGEAEWTAAFAAGRALSLEEAVAEALSQNT
jgi:predicted ATPase/transcriptional regulator with XRE-family HTH domain